MNLAPVLDVNDNQLNPVIGVRSFGASPTLVATYGRLAVRGSQDNGVMAVAKHFPGHGSVDVDSHGGLAISSSSVDALMAHELVPFRAAIEEGVAGIMTGHIAVPALDENKRPATLSPPILTGLLRRQFGYEALILTDSLGMGGVSASGGQAQVAVEAVLAGADILLSTSPMDAHVAIIQALVAAVERGEISVQRIDQSLRRILGAKHAYGLYEPLPTPDLDVVGSPEHQAIAREIARQAITLLRDEHDHIPLPPPPARLFLVSPDQLPPAASGEGSALAELLQGKGYETTELVFNLNSSASRDYVQTTALAQAPQYDTVIFGEWELIKRYVNWDDQWQEQLIQRLYQTSRNLIVVSWHNPAATVRCSQVPTFLVAYGNTPVQVSAVGTVLVGEQVPSGNLPISLLEVMPNEVLK
jgi:beta-N-acetylhexosaminidase